MLACVYNTNIYTYNLYVEVCMYASICERSIKLYKSASSRRNDKIRREIQTKSASSWRSIQKVILPFFLFLLLSLGGPVDHTERKTKSYRWLKMETCILVIVITMEKKKQIQRITLWTNLSLRDIELFLQLLLLWSVPKFHTSRA